jgi:hypothetical protein
MGKKMEMVEISLTIQSMAKQPNWQTVNRCTRWIGT